MKKIILGFTTFGHLKQTRLLNMDCASEEVTERIQEHWCRYLHEEGKSDEWIKSNVEWGMHHYMSDRPDLLARLAKEPEFGHLALIVHQVVAGSEVLKVGTILDRDAIKRAVCKAHPSLIVIFP